MQKKIYVFFLSLGRIESLYFKLILYVFADSFHGFIHYSTIGIKYGSCVSISRKIIHVRSVEKQIELLHISFIL